MSDELTPPGETSQWRELNIEIEEFETWLRNFWARFNSNSLNTGGASAKRISRFLSGDVTKAIQDNLLCVHPTQFDSPHPTHRIRYLFPSGVVTSALTWHSLHLRGRVDDSAIVGLR